MNRRTAIKQFAMATATAWLLPACVSDPKKVSIVLNRLEVSGDEETLLANIAAVMIPQTETPGAVAVKAHLFALVMVDDCLGKADQEKFLKGMRRFESDLQVLTKKKFSDASAAERLDMLTVFEKALNQPGGVNADTAWFYRKTRGYIVQGYTSSQYFLTEVKPYQLVPGPHYNGCAPAVSTSKVLS